MAKSTVQTALVTNASGYAGPPAVDALVKAGFRVLVHDRKFSEVAAWEAFSRTHPYAEVIVASDATSLATSAWEQAGEIHAIVSNDHYPAVQSPTENASLSELRLTLERLIVEPFSFLQMAIPRLKAQGHGNLIMVTSCRTHAPIPGGAIPDLARAASNALVKSLAVELAPHGIAVNAIAPNYLYSEAYYPRAIFIDDPKGRAYVRSNVPIGRLGQPDEIGELIRFLAATNARFLTGAIVDFNGAWPFSPIRPQ
jgi:3-oxoacyl-[acyl-carrier protein] reductase